MARGDRVIAGAAIAASACGAPTTATAAHAMRGECGAITMQPLMWQHDIAGVAHNIRCTLDVVGALDDAPDDASASSALAAGQM